VKSNCHGNRVTNVGEGFKPSRPPIPFGGLRMPFADNGHDHDKGNGRDFGVCRQRPTAKKPTTRIFQIPHRNHPSHFVLPVRRFVIP
jgi:hypothetical protein